MPSDRSGRAGKSDLDSDIEGAALGSCSTASPRAAQSSIGSQGKAAGARTGSDVLEFVALMCN